MNYDTWISQYVTEREGKVSGLCLEACEAMQDAFPELRLVHGYVYDRDWGRCGHFWCVTPDDAIVDPTKTQFPSFIDYETIHEFLTREQVRAYMEDFRKVTASTYQVAWETV